MTSARVLKDKLVWDHDGLGWPNRDKSQFVDAGGLRWHVQTAGNGPVMLLIHGTAAATHSWGGLLPLLAARYTVVAPDLPGHGFTVRTELADVGLVTALEPIIHPDVHRPQFSD